jgi:DNA-binding response OmpR family regulator
MVMAVAPSAHHIGSLHTAIITVGAFLVSDLDRDLADHGVTAHWWSADDDDLTTVDAVLVVSRGASTSQPSVIDRIRRMTTAPILVLSPHNSEIDVVVAFEMGADGYVFEPASGAVIAARLRALQRRNPPPDYRRGDVLAIDDIRLDLAARTVLVQQRPVELGRREFDVLALLMGEAGCVVARHEILNAISQGSITARINIDNTIRRLRRSIERDPDHPERIISVRSVGYKFAVR